MSSQKRKREVPVRKGFNKVAAAKTATPEVVEYDDSDDGVSPKPTRPRRAAASPKVPVVQSPVRSPVKTTGANKKQAAPVATAPAADSNKVKFQYPNCELKWSDNSAVFNSLSHRDRLVKALEAVCAQEAAALESYFMELSESETQKALKPELLVCLKEVLEETLDEVRSSCPANVEFQPEVAGAAGSGGAAKADALEAKRDKLQAQADELEGFLQNIGEFGKKHNVSTSLGSIEQLYKKVTGSSSSGKRASSSGDRYVTATNQLSEIVSNINQQCDQVIEEYINKSVKGTLAFVQQSQAGLYDTYQKVRGSTDPVVPKNKLLSPSYNSRADADADAGVLGKSLEVHHYVNLLQSQAGSSKPFAGTAAGASSSSAPTAAATKKQDSKKLLRGFGKT